MRKEGKRRGRRWRERKRREGMEDRVYKREKGKGKEE